VLRQTEIFRIWAASIFNSRQLFRLGRHEGFLPRLLPPFPSIKRRLFRFFLFNNCAFCSHHFGLSCDLYIWFMILLMMDRQDRGHDCVALCGDSPATRARDFGDEAMGVQ